MTSKFLLWLVATSLGSLAASDATAQTYKTLHSFTSVDPYTNTNSEGANPFSSVTVSEDALFGTTQYGGNSRSGSLFKMNVDGTGFTNLHNFNPNTDGNFPYRRLILSGNTLYGTTGQGGGSGNGTLFKINTDGTGFTNFHNFSALLSSTNTDGARPYGPLVLSGDTLYGTAFAGGLSGHGTVFKLQTDGSGFVTMHSFTGDGMYVITNSDGAHPYAGLVLSSNILYGTAYDGGASALGTVFAITTDGTIFTTLHSFSANEDASEPLAGLILSSNTLYGTTIGTTPNGFGAIFAVNTDGTGFRNLHKFTHGSDGYRPYGGLVLGGNTLYGTTALGGGVFAVNTDGTDFRVIYPLGRLGEAEDPYDDLVLSGDILYGTSGVGGSWAKGTVFSVLIWPRLTITYCDSNVVMTWPTNAVGFTLQSSIDLPSPAGWTNVLPASVIINGQNTVTNPIAAIQQFYRLSQ